MAATARVFCLAAILIVSSCGNGGDQDGAVPGPTPPTTKRAPVATAPPGRAPLPDDPCGVFSTDEVAGFVGLDPADLTPTKPTDSTCLWFDFGDPDRDSAALAAMVESWAYVESAAEHRVDAGEEIEAPGSTLTATDNPNLFILDLDLPNLDNPQTVARFGQRAVLLRSNDLTRAEVRDLAEGLLDRYEA